MSRYGEKDILVSIDEKTIRKDLENAGISLAQMSKKMGHGRSYLCQRFIKGTMPKRELGILYGTLSEPSNKTIEKKSIAPTPQEVEEYGKEIDFKVDGQYFCNYYESRNWKIKGRKIKDWKACVWTWKKNSEKWDTQRIDFEIELTAKMVESMRGELKDISERLTIVGAQIEKMNQILDDHRDMNHSLRVRVANIETELYQKKVRKSQLDIANKFNGLVRLMTKP